MSTRRTLRSSRSKLPTFPEDGHYLSDSTTRKRKVSTPSAREVSTASVAAGGKGTVRKRAMRDDSDASSDDNDEETRQRVKRSRFVKHSENNSKLDHMGLALGPTDGSPYYATLSEEKLEREGPSQTANHIGRNDSFRKEIGSLLPLASDANGGANTSTTPALASLSVFNQLSAVRDYPATPVSSPSLAEVPTGGIFQEISQTPDHSQQPKNPPNVDGGPGHLPPRHPPGDTQSRPSFDHSHCTGPGGPSLPPRMHTPPPSHSSESPSALAATLLSAMKDYTAPPSSLSPMRCSPSSYEVFPSRTMDSELLKTQKVCKDPSEEPAASSQKFDALEKNTRIEIDGAGKTEDDFNSDDPGSDIHKPPWGPPGPVSQPPGLSRS